MNLIMKRLLNKFTVVRSLSVLLLISIAIFSTACYPILQSAEITPPKKFTHTVRTGALAGGTGLLKGVAPNGVGYHFGYGLYDNIEVNGDLDLFFPRISLGLKGKLLDKLSIGINSNIFFDKSSKK